MKRQRAEKPITFTEEDARGVQFSHNVVVNSLNIEDYDVHRILVDNESSIDVLSYDAFSKMLISDSQLRLINSPQ